MALTKLEKAAGRAFRESWAARLAAKSAAAPCMEFIREYRHACPKRDGVSVAIALREHYETSPKYWVCYCSTVLEHPHDDCQGGKEVTPAGFFAFIWLDGRCPHCRQRVRSEGRLVLAAERGPQS